MKKIFLDHAATTPADPRVVEAMLPFFSESFGNPSSIHSLGLETRTAVAEAREKVASLIGAASDEIVFTSGGTEADNLAIKGKPGSLPPPATHEVQQAHPIPPSPSVHALRSCAPPTGIAQPGLPNRDCPAAAIFRRHQHAGVTRMALTHRWHRDTPSPSRPPMRAAAAKGPIA